LTITVTAHGWVEAGQALLRSGANKGDIIAVSGVIGDAGLGLKLALNQLKQIDQAWLEQSDIEHCLKALNCPQPQIALGRLLNQYANSAIDISDGLLADLGHILEQSNKLNGLNDQAELGAEIYIESLPISLAMQKWINQTQEWALPLSAGDDYQLCFTVSPENWGALQDRAGQLGLEIKAVGKITSGSGVIVKESQESNQQVENLTGLGYQHF
ncbi:MAG: thiamine-phosphate kinase, partial [Pseudomonadota bacterium]|nr:thiamine-phosphate kinase [Pseudomonadota bacterium]